MSIQTAVIPRTLHTYSATWALRPTSDLQIGDLFYATDRQVQYRWNGTAFVAISAASLSGTHAARPTASDYPEGSTYYETDMLLLFQVQSAAWVQITQGAPFIACNTVVYNSTKAASYGDLDLSAYIGIKAGFVFLKCDDSATSTCTFRQNGESANAAAQAIQYASVSATTITYVICPTDSNGVIEWIASNATDTWTITLLGYIR